MARALRRVRTVGPARRAAAAASLVWAVAVLAYGFGFFGASQARGTAFLDGAFFLLALTLPLILIWMAVSLAEELARQRDLLAALAEVVGPLIARLDAVGEGLERHGPASPAEIRKAVEAGLAAARGEAPGAALERVLVGQTRIEAAVGELRGRAPAPAPTRPEPARPPRPEPPGAARPRPPEPAPARHDEPGLPLLAEAEPEAELPWDDLVRALDFPRDAEDRDGFRALRLALRRRGLAQTLQAAEDVLTFLSQEGIYVDDLAPGPVDAGAWRRFLGGERGEGVAAVGGVRDEAALETARALTKQDPIFRDTALFFLRRFDAVLRRVAETASDEQIAQLADTRSGRAFQLMARASGSFA
jgi:hypothetical protein